MKFHQPYDFKNIHSFFGKGPAVLEVGSCFFIHLWRLLGLKPRYPSSSYLVWLLFVFAQCMCQVFCMYLHFDMCKKSVRNGTKTMTGWFCFYPYQQGGEGDGYRKSLPFATLSEQGTESLMRQHATSYGALTWLELRRVQNFQ